MENPAAGDILLGKYRIERVLGKGGMGVVAAARHLDLGGLFAIKFLLPSTLGQPEALERFLREARAAARLRGEHVARVHDVGRMENGAPYMVLEYLDGCDLKEVLKKQGPLSVEETVTYLLQVCDAIAEAHAAGIVHRDLKPANLFLTQRPNGSPCVKVLDFGISKVTGPEEVDLTGTGAMFGSPLYMSPEQIAKTKSVDARTDIWAMGVILYELLTGVTPFKAASMLEVVSGVLQEEPAPPRQRRPDLLPAIEAVILRCLRKNREERFQSVAELMAALRAAVGWPAEAPLGRGSMPSASGWTAMGAAVVSPPEEATTPLPRTAVVATVPLPPRPLPIAETPSTTTAGEGTTAAWGRTGKPAIARPRSRWPVAAGATLGVVGIAAAAWRLVGTSPVTAELPAPATQAIVSPPASSEPVVPAPVLPPPAVETATEKLPAPPAPSAEPATKTVAEKVTPAPKTAPQSPSIAQKTPAKTPVAEATTRATPAPAPTPTATEKKHKGLF